MEQKKRTGGTGKGGGAKRSRAAKPKAPDKLEPGFKPEEKAAPKVMPFPSVKPDHILMVCNRCGRRMTLRTQNPDTPGMGPYQGYCRRPSCMVEYVVQVNPIG